MPISMIDPKPALVVIDLQKGILAAAAGLAHPAETVIAHSRELADAFRRHELPVVLVNVTGGAPGRTDAGGTGGQASAPHPEGWADLIDDLDVQPGDHLVTKQTWGAFHGTDLHAHLASLGVTQIVLTGISTSAGVETTARAAYEHGYHVVLATDAMTDRSADVHRNSVERIFPRLGETATTAEILELLEKSV